MRRDANWGFEKVEKGPGLWEKIYDVQGRKENKVVAGIFSPRA